ncbi:trypsin-like peptidase domain-containing protein [Paraburkholderia nemoris]|uniref:trypsin-like peptidase domain-containing protein n=1 Tax=Paraburkholderia nemoris TaxID=2793076 RepID=UPI0038B8E311
MRVKTLLKQLSIAIGSILAVCLPAHSQQPANMPDASVSFEIGKRIIHIHYPLFNADNTLSGLVDGSGFMLDAHRALTAAHVVRDAASAHLTLIVQVGALANRTNYLTTAHVLAIDSTRDLAMLWVDAGNFVGRPTLADTHAKICDNPPKGGSRYLVGGTADSSTGSAGAIEKIWRPLPFEDVTVDLSRVPKLDPAFTQQHRLHWKEGSPVIALGSEANPGDSGGAVLSMTGCLWGIVSSDVQVAEPVDSHLGMTFAEPIAPADPFLKTGEQQ